MFAFGLAFVLLCEGTVDHPAHDSADEDCERGADGEIGSHGECERTNAKQFYHDDEGYAEENERPGELATKDAVDDGRHEAALWGGGLFAADALDPLDLDLAGGGIIEVFAVGERG